MFCFKKQPRIKYALSGGRALGGSAINTVVKPFINSIVKDQVSKGGGVQGGFTQGYSESAGWVEGMGVRGQGALRATRTTKPFTFCSISGQVKTRLWICLRSAGLDAVCVQLQHKALVAGIATTALFARSCHDAARIGPARVNVPTSLEQLLLRCFSGPRSSTHCWCGLSAWSSRCHCRTFSRTQSFSEASWA